MKYIDFKENIDENELKECAQILREGGIGIFPTETVYGIGTNGLNSEDIKRIYDIKNRPYNKPISLLVSDITMIEKVAKNITEIEYKIIKNFFPGPITLILEKSDIVPDILTSGGNTVGVRMPEEKIALELIKNAGVPIATPSANITGKKSGTNYEEIIEDFKDKVDFFIDGGNSRIGQGSTIVKIENNIPKILRQGAITLEEIMEKIN